MPNNPIPDSEVCSLPCQLPTLTTVTDH
jgi:hypothetical protein